MILPFAGYSIDLIQFHDHLFECDRVPDSVKDLSRRQELVDCRCGHCRRHVVATFRDVIPLVTSLQASVYLTYGNSTHVSRVTLFRSYPEPHVLSWDLARSLSVDVGVFILIGRRIFGIRLVGTVGVRRRVAEISPIRISFPVPCLRGYFVVVTIHDVSDLNVPLLLLEEGVGLFLRRSIIIGLFSLSLPWWRKRLFRGLSVTTFAVA